MNDKPEYTDRLNSFGIILMIGISILFISYLHYQLYSKPILPALRNFMVNIHASLGLMAYASVITSLIVSILGVVKIRQIPKIVNTLQTLCIITFTLSIILGSFWARKAWGSPWSWDPKEIYTLFLLLLIMFPVFLIIRFTNFNWLKVFALTFQLIAVVFVAYIVRILSGLHSYNILF